VQAANGAGGLEREESIMTRILLSMVAWALIAATTTSAHHSFAAAYFEGQSITLEGVVREFQYRSPHALVVFDVRDADGRSRAYTAEWGSPNRLNGRGVTKETLKPGDVVVVTGSPGRVASDYKVHLKAIRRASDGWSWGGGGRR
jgi:hypothetical protein